jgi:hypothetical protein
MQNLPCVLSQRERQSVVPERYPGSNWLTGSQHQVNATLATRTSLANDAPRLTQPFMPRWRPLRAMSNWLELHVAQQGKVWKLLQARLVVEPSLFVVLAAVARSGLRGWPAEGMG